MFEDAKPDDKINMTVGEFTTAIADTRRAAIEECRAIAERKCNARTIGSFEWQTASDIENLIRALQSSNAR